jgi:hypothetical protein
MENKEEKKPEFKMASPETFQQFQDAMTPEMEMRQLKEFIYDYETPTTLKNRFFSINDKQAVLGNLDAKEILRLDIKEDLVFALHFMGIQRWRITFDNLFDIEQLKLKSFKANRRGKMGFERQALITTILRQKADVTTISEQPKKKRFRWF